MLLPKVWKNIQSIYVEVVGKRKVETMSFWVAKHSLYVPFTLSLSAFKALQIRQLNIYLSYATLNVAL